jgi:hypothetical protein
VLKHRRESRGGHDLNGGSDGPGDQIGERLALVEASAAGEGGFQLLLRGHRRLGRSVAVTLLGFPADLQRVASTAFEIGKEAAEVGHEGAGGELRAMSRDDVRVGGVKVLSAGRQGSTALTGKDSFDSDGVPPVLRGGGEQGTHVVEDAKERREVVPVAGSQGGCMAERELGEASTAEQDVGASFVADESRGALGVRTHQGRDHDIGLSPLGRVNGTDRDGREVVEEGPAVHRRVVVVELEGSLHQLSLRQVGAENSH